MSSSSQANQRIFGLDLFRAVAILLVVFGHGAFLLNNTFLEGFPYIKMIDGVDLFFVLSGFLIGSILLKDINAREKFGGHELLHFWKRRWFRTLPAYYLVLLLNYFFVKHQVIHEHIDQFDWKFLVFMQNISSPFYGFFWESWSLSIEEWFYILSPLLLIAFLLLLKPKQAFLLVTVLMLIVPVIIRFYKYQPAIDPYWYDVGFRKIVITRLDSIAYGLLAAWVFLYARPIWEKGKYIFLVAGIALMVFILNYEMPVTSIYAQVIYFSITPLSAGLLLPFFNSIQKSPGLLGKGITHISKISYAMYLVNLALVAEVMAANFPPQGGIDGVLKYVLFWTIVLVASTILYRFFEKPVMDLRDKKVNQKPV